MVGEIVVFAKMVKPIVHRDQRQPNSLVALIIQKPVARVNGGCALDRLEILFITHRIGKFRLHSKLRNRFIEQPFRAQCTRVLMHNLI